MFPTPPIGDWYNTFSDAQSGTSSADFIATRGYNSIDDGGGAIYQKGTTNRHSIEFENSANVDYHFYAPDFEVTAKQCGAYGNGINDDTAALNVALQSGLNVILDQGIFLVSDTLRFTGGGGAGGNSGNGLRLVGRGRLKSVIKIDSTYSATLAVLRVTESGQSVSDIGFEFEQPVNVSNRSQATNYPFAIHVLGINSVNANAADRCRLSRVRISNTSHGIRCQDNVGGLIMDDIEVGTFDIGVDFFGNEPPADTVELHNVRVWPYGMDPSMRQNVYSDGQNRGFIIRRVDDLKMLNCTPFQSSVSLLATDGVGPFGTMVGLALDGQHSKVVMEAGEIQIVGCYGTSNLTGDIKFLVTGGQLKVSCFDFDIPGSGSGAFVVDPPQNVSATALFSNGTVNQMAGVNSSIFRVRAGGLLQISNCRIGISDNVTRNIPLIIQEGGSIVVTDNTCNGDTTGTCTFVDCRVNNRNIVALNNARGCNFDFPTNQSMGIYVNNKS